ncbi:hypothetical protein ACE6H2_026768 [Prunus campanulata]
MRKLRKQLPFPSSSKETKAINNERPRRQPWRSAMELQAERDSEDRPRRWGRGRVLRFRRER